MNKTRLLFRLTLAGTVLFLAGAAALSLVDGALRLQIALLALGILCGSLSSQLRFRMVLSTQRTIQQGLRSALRQLADERPGLADTSDTTASAAAFETVLTGLGDTQAAVAATESFLLAELVGLRQRLLTEAEPPVGGEEPAG